MLQLAVHTHTEELHLTSAIANNQTHQVTVSGVVQPMEAYNRCLRNSNGLQNPGFSSSRQQHALHCRTQEWQQRLVVALLPSFLRSLLRCIAQCVQWKEQHPAIPAPHSHSPNCCTHSNAGNGGQISGKPCFLVTNSSAIPPRICCDMAIAPSAVDGKLASNSTTP